jgi:putative ABC transport system substrate-binding protein
MRLKRRTFIAALGGAAVWPVAARAQQPAKTPTVGMLAAGTPASHGKWVDASVARLRELGWNDGRNVAIAYRWSEGRDERVVELAAEFVRLNVDVIVTSSSQAVKTVMKATSQIPIVAAGMTDPISLGIIKTLARPGGNVSGLTLQTDELVGKRIELLHEIVPDLHHIAVLGYAASPAFLSEVSAAKAAAPALGMDVTVLGLREVGDIVPAIESLKGRTQALYVPITPFIAVNQTKINSLALDARLPIAHGLPELVRSGGLLSYGADFLDLFRRAGDYVDRILRGTKPAELPVEQPTKFDLVINLKTAKALGLAFPTAMLATANEVIE